MGGRTAHVTNIAVAILLPIVLGVAVLSVYREWRTVDASKQRRHCCEILVSVETVIGAVERLHDQITQLANRSATVTVESVRQAEQRVEQETARLADLASYDPQQVQRVADWQQLLTQQETRYQTVLSALARGDAARARELVSGDAFYEAEHQGLKLLEAIEAVERTRLASLEDAEVSATRRASRKMLVGSALAALLSISALLLIHRETRRRNQAEAALQEANATLEQRVAERTAQLAQREAELLREIEERARVQAALQESDEQHRAIFERNPVPMWMYDLDTLQFRAVNEAAILHYGYSREQFLAMDIRDIRPTEDRERVVQVARNAPMGYFDAGVWRHLRRDGSQISAHVYWNTYRVGGTNCRLVAAIDVTERTRAEAERKLLMTAIEQSPDIVFITDRGGTIQYVNPAFERLTGHSRAEAVGSNPRILKSGQHDARFYQDFFATLMRGENWTGTFINRRKNGSTFEIEASVSPVRDSAGKTIAFVAHQHDMSVRRELENKLRLGQKMEALGSLAGGVAHDFNNILTPILGFTDLARSQIDPGHPLQRHLCQIQTASERAKDLVRQILTFSRQVDTQRRPTQITPIVQEVTKLVRASLPSTIDIQLKLNAPDACLLCDPGQIHQVLMNLVANAYHAMRETGGTLGIALVTEVSDGKPYVLLEVSDTGHGMTREVAERIFEPYFTTKSAGEGTGLGLSVVHGIVTAVGGTIAVTSDPGVGTRFLLRFPRHEPTDAEAACDTPSDARDGAVIRHGHVLVVDDEPAICELVQGMLESFGYTAETCSSAEDALRRVNDKGNHYDALITDLTMPRVTGSEVAQRARAVRPDLPIVLMTGYYESSPSGQTFDLKHVQILHKPIKMRDLAAALQRCMDGSSGASSAMSTAVADGGFSAPPAAPTEPTA